MLTCAECGEEMVAPVSSDQRDEIERRMPAYFSLDKFLRMINGDCRPCQAECDELMEQPHPNTCRWPKTQGYVKRNTSSAMTLKGSYTGSIFNVRQRVLNL